MADITRTPSPGTQIQPPSTDEAKGPAPKSVPDLVGNKRVTDFLKNLPGAGSGTPAPIIAPLYGVATAPDPTCAPKPVLALMYGMPPQMDMGRPLTDLGPPKLNMEIPGPRPLDLGSMPKLGCEDKPAIAMLYGAPISPMPNDQLMRPTINTVYGIPMPGVGPSDCLPAPTIVPLYGISPGAPPPAQEKKPGRPAPESD
ncbi:MAG: hypothetical protein JRI25_21060 [Deltaproteobacteria bacterium]|nr:hypothetical protein [Deltaproteobacteria bacterium]